MPVPMSGASKSFRSAFRCSAAIVNQSEKFVQIGEHVLVDTYKLRLVRCTSNLPSKSEPPLVLKCLRSLSSSSAYGI